MGVKLTLKQQKFADYYIELGNASEAARRAEYSKKYAAQNTDNY
ncbi:terminase small subunit [Aciduricibacillus chroicocephali]|uniref:Terminase small subunit n=1 Tax=Aciduricibacillus chroicocephali TaxID=3054939 RepID=A0ABY9KYL1_9BACI|nr:terminase small subunit [Bacillaceae bacterium 44XB]